MLGLDTDEVEPALDKYLSGLLAASWSSGDDFVRLLGIWLAQLNSLLSQQNVSLCAFGVTEPFAAWAKGFATLPELQGALLKSLQALCRSVGALNPSVGSTAKEAVRKAVAYIERNYASRISLSAMAEMVYLNASYFSVQFKRVTGRNFIDYLTDVRMARAKKLLEDGDLRVYEVGERVGYQNPRYFADIFRKYAGMTPQEYRQTSEDRK